MPVAPRRALRVAQADVRGTADDTAQPIAISGVARVQWIEKGDKTDINCTVCGRRTTVLSGCTLQVLFDRGRIIHPLRRGAGHCRRDHPDAEVTADLSTGHSLLTRRPLRYPSSRILMMAMTTQLSHPFARSSRHRRSGGLREVGPKRRSATQWASIDPRANNNRR